ncbi:MAG TPA: DUF1822 family protein [Trichormus sp. M33_DOE_039]|nr:DUF1822 family protein [Trichormus sp. M33_DOE_039]
MINIMNNYHDLRILLPELISLEPEDFDWAKNNSNYVNNEPQQWQAYLNSLALIGCETWLKENLPQQAVKKDLIANAAYLRIGNFKFCILATEHLLDEVVNIPQNLVSQSELTAHFYLIVEVIEEQEEIILRGFLRYDQLLVALNAINFSTTQDNFYEIPLSKFDPEPNHLLFYCLYTEPAAIPLPVVTQVFQQQSLEHMSKKKTKLSQWLQHEFDEMWQAIETLIDPNTSLVFSLRNTDKMIRRGKLIDLGMQLGSEKIALLVNITREVENKLRVLIQLHPTGKQKFLPSNIKLSLLSETGTLLYEVSSRTQDNYIQLKSFKGEEGNSFSIEVSLDDIKIREKFEL